MSNSNRKIFGLGQYKSPFNYELSGKHFHIFMDNGKEYLVNFLDGEILDWAEKGEAYKWDTYECLKGDDTTYFVHIQPQIFGGKVSYSWILDLVQNLVTLVITEEGVIPAADRLIRVTPVFGAIKLLGRPLSEKRHSFTDRMVGEHIIWHYNPTFAAQHIYHTPNLYRLPRIEIKELRKIYEDKSGNITNPEDLEKMEKLEASFTRSKDTYPICEEPCFHIRISDTMNLFCFCEENGAMKDPEHAIGGGGLILLQDIERLIDVGLGYGLGEYSMLTAYGERNENGDPLDDVASPYDQTKLQSMPCIYQQNWN
jgi:hypothetical protein